MNSLVDVFSHYQRIVSSIADANGEITPELNSELERIDRDLAQKADSYHSVIQRLEKEAELFKKRKEESQRIEKACNHAIEFLEARIKSVLESVGEIHGQEVTAKLVNNPPKLVIEEKMLPKEFTKTIVEVVPNKELIKEQLDLGFKVPGAEYQRGKRIKFVTRSKELK